MISRTAEYALRAVVCLAVNGGLPLTTQQIAGASRVPPGYLAKILQSLVKAGIITSQRGMNGGFLLGRPPEQMTLLDVIQSVDGSHRIGGCPMGIEEHRNALCPLHQRLDQAAAVAEQVLNGASIDDLLKSGADHLKWPSFPTCAAQANESKRSG